MQLKISDIYVKDRIRQKQTPGGLADMAQSLKENGQFHAVVVRPPRDAEEMSNGKPWILVAGGRRIGGAILADWTEIRAHDMGQMTPYQAMKIELEENLQREDMHFADVAETKLRLHELYQSENPAQQIQETAASIGESLATVSRDIALAKAIRVNPALRNASSRKAALVSVKVAEHGRAKVLELQARGDTGSVFAERMVTQDAQVWLHEQPTASVDLLLSDVPYGIEYFDLPVGSDLSRYDDSAATTRPLLEEVVPEMVRVTASSGWLVLFTGWEGYFYIRDTILSRLCSNHFRYFEPGKRFCLEEGSGKLSPCAKLQLPIKPWIWYRPNSRNNSMHPDLHAQNQYEPILVVNRGAGKIVSDERTGNVLVHEADYIDRIHEMQKPIPLGCDIISRFCVRGSVIADPFFGSGAFLAAAAQMSCEFRGCDNNPNQLEVAHGLVSLHYKG